MKMTSSVFGLAVVLVVGGPLGSRASDANPSVENLDVAVLEKKVSEGDIDAKYQLGRALFRGEGVGQDIPRAAVLIREAAEAGDPRAMDGLGFLYLSGQGFDADETKALEWFEKGARAGYPKAQINAGLLWRQAKTIERSNEKGLAWLKKAADGGSLEAKEILGQIYFTGDRLQPRDYNLAGPYLLESAEGGNPVVQNMLGVAYRDGYGVEANRELSIKWFRVAAEQNNAKAQSNLAHALGVDSPASPDRREALVWLIVASKQGEPRADKTLKELQFSIPGPLMILAQSEAEKKLMVLTAQSASKEKKAWSN
ncbi:MAG: hypothetical protein Fur0032_13270 [Terrimicrobiaceae bacterium]